MIRFSQTAAALVLAAAIARPGALQAQLGSTHYLVAAGATLPTGSFADDHDVGYHGIVGLEMVPLGSQIGFRLEGVYNEFNQKTGNDKAHAGGVIANAVFELSPPTRTTAGTLYAIGGLGYYSTRDPSPLFNVSSQTNLGWNIGGGFRFPLTGFSAYVEARYHSVNNVGIKFLPITFGLSF